MKQKGIRKKIAFILIGCSLLTGCGGPLSRFVPSYVQIEGTLDLSAPKTVSIYEAKKRDFRQSEAVKRLLGTPIQDVEAHATGITYWGEQDYLGQRSLLNIVDFGNALGEPFSDPVTGSFSYCRMRSQGCFLDDYGNLELTCRRKQPVDEVWEDTGWEKLCPDTDLSFATRQEVQEKIEHRFAQWGIQLTPASCYSYTEETLAQIARKQEEINGQPVTYTGGELYGLSFWQTVDGIPLTDVSWTWKQGIRRQVTPEVTAWQNENGLLQLEANQIVTVGEQVRQLSVLDGRQALYQLDQYYGSQPQALSRKVTDGRLMYGVFFKGSGEKELLLVPVWMFCVESEWKDDLERTYQRVDYMAVHAETGEICGEPRIREGKENEF